MAETHPGGGGGGGALEGVGGVISNLCFPREGQKDPPASYFTRPPGG